MVWWFHEAGRADLSHMIGQAARTSEHVHSASDQLAQASAANKLRPIRSDHDASVASGAGHSAGGDTGSDANQCHGKWRGR